MHSGRRLGGANVDPKSQVQAPGGDRTCKEEHFRNLGGRSRDETNGMVQDCVCARVHMCGHMHECVQHTCTPVVLVAVHGMCTHVHVCVPVHTCAFHTYCVCTCVGVGVFLECVAGTGWGLGVLG